MPAMAETIGAGSLRQITGDVDLAIGDITHRGDLHIAGNVTDGRTVKASGNVRIDGVAQLACVEAAGALTVTGGIKAGDKGRFCAGGNVAARYLSGATLDAGGNVVVTTEVIDSRLVCGGRLIIRDGALVAGHAVATGGIRCLALGAQGGSVRTIVEVGIDAPFRMMVADAIKDIERWTAAAQKIRHNVAPLLQHRRTLTPEQKEQATELVFKADEMESGIQELLGKLRVRYTAARERSRPRLRVMQVVYPPVTIRMPGLEADINEEIAGPVWIVSVGAGKSRYIAIRKHGRIVKSLSTRDTANKAILALQRLLKLPGAESELA
jgi:uncharacterized protein